MRVRTKAGEGGKGMRQSLLQCARTLPSRAVREREAGGRYADKAGTARSRRPRVDAMR